VEDKYPGVSDPSVLVLMASNVTRDALVDNVVSNRSCPLWQWTLFLRQESESTLQSQKNKTKKPPSSGKDMMGNQTNACYEKTKDFWFECNADDWGLVG